MTRLCPMTVDTGELIAAGWQYIRAAFRPRFWRVKCGVMLDDVLLAEDAPRTLFDAPSPWAAATMAAMNGLNARYGRNTMFMAAADTTRAWKLRAEHHSPSYTTRLADVPVVRA